jgi:glycosyltransferase involved in cell wall biosynthesis
MKVSVAICTYNGEKYIEEQINSIINQTKKIDEIVLCDDRSSDKTVTIASEILNNCGIPYLIEVNSSNLGVVKNFEKAVGLTTGDVIFFSDQDDVWKLHKVELVISKFESVDSCVMVFSDADLVDENRNKIGTKLWETLSFSISEFTDKNFVEILLNRCVVTGATMAIRRDLYINTLPFNEFWVHDGWLAINASLYGKVIAIDQPLIEYRQHGGNVIGALKLNSIGRVKKYLRNINILEKERKLRVDRYNAFYNHGNRMIDDNIKKEVLKCVIFWKDLDGLRSKGILKGIRVIFRNSFNGNYKKYYTGLRGAIRDFAYLFARKMGA